MAARISAKLGSLVALALGVGLEGAEVALPEPATGSEAEVMIAVWDKLVAEEASCLGMDCRRRLVWAGKLDCIARVLVGNVVPKVLTGWCD